MSHTDLEKRLRERTIAVRGSAGVFTTVLSHKPDALCIEAADALSSLTRKLEEAREALAPFAEYASDIDEDAFGSALDDESFLLNIASAYEVPIGNPSVGDLRRAREVHRCLSRADADVVTDQGEK